MSTERTTRVCIKVGDGIRWVTMNGAHIPIDTDTGEVAKDLLYDEKKFKELAGPEFKGVRGQSAVHKLLEEKRGHVRGAFHRKDIGDIDLIWGNEHLGLSHIISRRSASGLDGAQFVKDLSDVVENGTILHRKDRKNYEIWHQGKLIVVSETFMGANKRLVVTAFPSRKKPARFNEQA